MRRLLCLCFLCLCCITLLSACSAKQHSSRAYTVRGKTYYPLRSARGFSEEGIATWYGSGFHGKRTASGERYDQSAMTAAHTILPLGTKVRVTNLENDCTVQVRINDRGPFSEDRCIDLSRAAGERLGIIGRGSGRVRLEALSE